MRGLKGPDRMRHSDSYPEAYVLRQEAAESLQTYLQKTLTPDEYVAVRHSMGLFGAEEESPADVGILLDVSADWVRTLLRTAATALSAGDLERARVIRKLFSPGLADLHLRSVKSAIA